jgi:hypothetical protein
MAAPRIVAIAPLTAIALLGCIWGVYEWFVPPFTDQEIRDSFVDTWEPSAWATLAALAVLGGVTVISLSILPFARRRGTRTIAIATLVMSVAAGLLVYRNHVALTDRTTALTGQTFGRFHGLL